MPSRGENILVVDDEQNIRFLLRSTLESDGFAVSEAANGTEAIDSIERQKPALVLLDLWMQGSGGMMVLEYLNQKEPKQRPRVIVLTANSQVPVVVKAMRLGASDFLEKPTTPEDLRLSVAAALEEDADAETSQAEAPPAARAVENLSPILARIRQAVWNQDIHFIEHTLSALFRKAWSDPTWFNLLGAVFEAEGNRSAAKTFYQKAVNAPPGCEAAARNLVRLENVDADHAAEVDLGEQDKFLSEILELHESYHSDPLHSNRSHP
jgi:DNA-binding response OmpR family regulator